jgi:hypothetical protein
MQLVVLVKAAPVLTNDLEETMCVAGARVDGPHPEWVRIHPVPFRDLDDDSKFAKYQTVTADVRRSRSDRRPETWCPIGGTIVPSESMGTDDAWARRRHLVNQLFEATMCELVEANRSGSGPGTHSLAVVRTPEPPRLRITERDEEQLQRWRQRAQAVASRVSLFDDLVPRKPDFEVVPWRFQYQFHCLSSECKGHEQTIVDWEVLALWRRVRHRADWRELIQQRFETDLWQGRDSLLFVGNQEQRPASFLVLGVFWPPAGPVQGVLDMWP